MSTYKRNNDAMPPPPQKIPRVFVPQPSNIEKIMSIQQEHIMQLPTQESQLPAHQRPTRNMSIFLNGTDRNIFLGERSEHFEKQKATFLENKFDMETSTSHKSSALSSKETQTPSSVSKQPSHNKESSVHNDEYLELTQDTVGIQNTNFGQCRKKEGNKRSNIRSTKIRFNDIIGHGAAKLRLDEALLPLALPRDLYLSILTGVRAAPASILLYGPPGCGKTKLAHAVAGEAQAILISVGPSDILSKFVGESEAAIKSLFKKARRDARLVESRCAVIFFDEIDALGQSRGSGAGGGHDSADGGESGGRRLLAELLIQMTKLSNSDESSDDEDYFECDSEELHVENFTSLRESEVHGDQNESFKDNITQMLCHQPDGKCGEILQENEKLPNDNTFIKGDFNSEMGEQRSGRVISPLFSSSSQSCVQDVSELINEPESTHNHTIDQTLAGSSPHKSMHVAHDESPSCTIQNKPRIIVVAATNRPTDCDPALLRRFAVRVLVDLPSRRDRRKIIQRLLSDIDHSISIFQLEEIAAATEGWSGSDLESLTREAAMAPIRDCLKKAASLKSKARKIGKKDKRGIDTFEVRGDTLHDEDAVARDSLLCGLKNLRSVSLDDFELAMSFWAGDQNIARVSRIGKRTKVQPYYDSGSSDEEQC